MCGLLTLPASMCPRKLRPSSSMPPSSACAITILLRVRARSPTHTPPIAPQPASAADACTCPMRRPDPPRPGPHPVGAPDRGPAVPHEIPPPPRYRDAMATPLSSVTAGRRGATSAPRPAPLRAAGCCEFLGAFVRAPQCIMYCARNLAGYSIPVPACPQRRRPKAVAYLHALPH